MFQKNSYTHKRPAKLIENNEMLFKPDQLQIKKEES